MITIIPLILIILSLAVMLVIAIKHVPKTAALDIASLPEEREAHLKSSLLEKRLLRKIGNAARAMSSVAGPAAKHLGGLYKHGVKRIRSLERLYRLQSGSPLPDSAEKADARIGELLERAQESFTKADYEDAEQAYLSIIKINPGQSEAYHGLGEVYRKEEQWDQAREIYQYMIEHWPQDSGVFASLALVEEATGNLEGAKDHFLHALSINNEIVEHHLDLAELYQKLDEPEKSLSSLQKAQQLEPNNPRVLDQLLQVSILLGRKELAEEAFDKLRAVNPEHGKLDELKEKIKSLP